MTHKDIYTKFMIEYDKANVTSSYPSLTEYEVATLLDKAYNALIAQKVTGNNPRRVPFEADNKAIADIAPLIKHVDLGLFKDGHEPAINILQYPLPDDFMYYVSSALNYITDTVPMDNQDHRLVPMQIVTHQTAERFFNTPYNMPWVKKPVTYAEGNSMFVVYDPIDKPMINSVAHLSYIKKPKRFVDSIITNQDNNGNTNTDPIIDPDNTGVFILNKSQLNSNDKIQ